MLRLLIVWFGTYALLNTDTESNNVFESTIFPIANVFYILFLSKEFIRFLYSLSASGTKGNEVNVVDFMFDVWTLLYEDIKDKYSGRFGFLGGFSGFLEDLLIPIEIVLVIVSFYNELQLLAYLAN